MPSVIKVSTMLFLAVFPNEAWGRMPVSRVALLLQSQKSLDTPITEPPMTSLVLASINDALIK